MADISVTEVTPAVPLSAVTQTTVTATEDITSATITPVVAEANHINNNAEKAIISAVITNGCPTDITVTASAAEDESVDDEDESLPANTNVPDGNSAGKEVSTGSLKKVETICHFPICNY